MDETFSIRREQRSGPKRNLPHISKKDSISISFARATKKLQLILEGNAGISDMFNHLHFTKDKQKYFDFCNNIFPYPFFYEKIMLDDETSLPYFQIFTIFTATKHCPIEYKQGLANDTDFIQFLFPTFLAKYQFQGAESCFQLFSHLILFSIPLRDYLFTSGIIDYFNNTVALIPQLAHLSKASPYIERFYTRSLRFFCNCLIMEPLLNEMYIKPIIQVFNTILDCQIGSVISYFVKRFKKSKQIKKNYPEIYDILASYISSNFSNVDNPQIISIIYKYLRNKIDSEEYYNFTMQYLINVNSITVQRQCLKQIIHRHDDWASSKGEEICSTILEIFSSMPYQLQTLCIQVLMLYCPLDNLINEISLGYIIQLAGDKSIGIHCLSCIFEILSKVTLTQEQKTLLIDLVNDSEQLFADLVSNGTAEQSELATSILSIIEDIGNE